MTPKDPLSPTEWAAMPPVANDQPNMYMFVYTRFTVTKYVQELPTFNRVLPTFTDFKYLGNFYLQHTQSITR